jgi:hypothetical protein
VRRLVPTVALVAVAVLAGCSSDGSKAAGGTKRASTTTTTTAPPVAPLTGLPDPDGGSQARPVLSIKVDNVGDARPQTGVDAADVVWDEVVEGQATRLLAMFQSQVPESVGPVRSVRRTDPLIVWPVGGIFAYSGGARYAIDAIEAAPVLLVDESSAGDGMYRESSRRAPHNLYARPGVLFRRGGEPVPPPALFDYSPTPVTAGSAVAAVRVGFSGSFAPTYTWDAASGTWPRSTSDGPFTVASGAQIAPANVVVLPVVYDGGVGQIGAEARLVGEGPVQVFTNGRLVEGTWRRASQADRIELVDAAGSPILLTPGPTWVELPDVSYAIDVTPAPAP